MRGLLLLVMTAGCRQLLGFENATVGDAAIGSDGDPDVPPVQCSGPEQCAGATPICANNFCVECTGSDTSACTPEQPFCGFDNTCRGCISNDDCATSELCLASGVCADPMTVAYVAEGGTGDCSQASPCARIQDALNSARSIFKVTGTVTDTVQVNLDRSVDIYGATGAAITRANNGPILDINNETTSVRLFGLIIKDGTSNAGSGLRVNDGTLFVDASLIANNAGLGIDARNATSVTLRRSILFNNEQGGANLENTTFTITNCLIVDNGSAGSSIGGLKIKPAGGIDTLELVTIANNVTDAFNSTRSAIRCDQPFVGHSNIVTGNALDPNCAFDHSLFDTVVPGVGNRMGPANFLSTLDPTALDFYRIAADSAAIDGAISTIPFDLDGQPRPVGMAPDMGADERP